MSGPQAESIAAVLRKCRLSELYLGPQKHLLTLFVQKIHVLGSVRPQRKCGNLPPAMYDDRGYRRTLSQ